jgi:hypothetical protein
MGIIQGVIYKILENTDQFLCIFFHIKIDPLACGSSVFQGVFGPFLNGQKQNQYKKESGHLSIKLNFIRRIFNPIFTVNLETGNNRKIQ